MGKRERYEPGTFCWVDLVTTDPASTKTFYGELFGWETEPQEEDGKLAYVSIKNAGFANGGIMPMTEQHCDSPPYWLVYFTVPSCNDTIAKVQELGGDALTGPLDIGAGRLAVVRSPGRGVHAL